MYKLLKWRILLAFIVTIIAVVLVSPNFSSVKDYSGRKINLGLDLRGGSHLLLDVDFNNYMLDYYHNLLDSLRDIMRKSKIGYKNISVSRDCVKFDLRNKEDFNNLKIKIADISENLSCDILDHVVTIKSSEKEKEKLLEKIVNRSIEIIRIRVDELGTKEPVIQKQGERNILLQVPGESDPNKLRKILGKTAKLTFHLVNDSLTSSNTKNVTPNDKVVFDNNLNRFVIDRKIILSGDSLIDSQVGFDKNSSPIVLFNFNNYGAKKFGNITNNNIGRRLAIILDNKLISAPVINEPIMSGSGSISGSFTIESANELAMLLRAGALPAPLDVVEERTVGPSLGSDSVNAGKKATIIGFLLVAIFMILYYGILGIFANIALSFALLYIMSLLTVLQATLTLPGIAGIILTIGMAVDSNVLIYERIKEEIRNGHSDSYAIKIGFKSALSAIIDSNVTTLIAAILLYIFGIGAIRGFAVTLTIGIIVSMFCALFITKLIIDCWVYYFRPKTLGL